MIPQDPVMLLSFINLKLRDFYGSLKQLCDDLDVKEQEITDKLAAITIITMKRGISLYNTSSTNPTEKMATRSLR